MCSRFTYIHYLRNEDEVEDKFMKYKAEVENKLDSKLEDIGQIRVLSMVQIY